jgi:small GTP-binding protein
MEDKKKNFTINVAVVGNAGVGKSSFINRILGRKFNEYIPPAVNFFYESFRFYHEHEKFNIIIKIWDTVGQEKFKSECSNVIKKADIIIFIRDNENNSIDEWLSFLDEKTDIKSEEVKMIFCLNKTDLLTANEKILFMKNYLIKLKNVMQVYMIFQRKMIMILKTLNYKFKIFL